MENKYIEELKAQYGSDARSRSLKETIAVEDRPREKALAMGFDSLSNSELLAIIIGSGTRGHSVTDLCREIMNSSGNSLYQLVQNRSVESIQKQFKGIGKVKAIQICAVLEIAKRYQREGIGKMVQLRSSADVYNCLRTDMEALDHEEMWMLTLNRAKHLTARVRVSVGGSGATVVDVKAILRRAIERNADSIIIAHNHPSNNPSPSPQDDSVTEKLRKACRAIELDFLDHIIVCRHAYYSYADEGRV